MRLASGCRTAVVLLVLFALPLGAFVELGGDCDFALESGGGEACVHGHDEKSEDQPGRCPPEHHGAARCGCACHHAGILIAPGRAPAPPPSGWIGLARHAALPDRRDETPLRPPIAG